MLLEATVSGVPAKASSPTFIGGLAAAFGMNASLYAILLYLVTYLQDGLH